jgi:hypothetical protein
VRVGAGADLRHRAGFDVDAGVASHPRSHQVHPSAAAFSDRGGLQVSQQELIRPRTNKGILQSNKLRFR